MTVPTTISASVAMGGDALPILLVYGIVYWLVLIAILKNQFMNTQEKILWFLVITLAPVIGIAAFWYVDPLPTQPVPSRVENQDTAR